MTKENWKNRIVGYGEEKPDQLLANPLNFRVHPANQQSALEGVLNEVGWVTEVIVNQTTNTLIDGHLRVALAMRRNEKTIPVKYVELSPEEEKLILATFDPISALATTDNTKLDELLQDISSSEQGVQELLAKMAEDAGIVPPDVDFKEYDETVENEVEYNECPECGHKWAK